ncbi:porin family protein [Flavobacterium sp.]|uniref:porin family protein n=1 Tax=Flavobacterium sp. TaxID=239 RepID=UPI00286E7213|nr:porin family protein [Flavobacterium sp.]
MKKFVLLVTLVSIGFTNAQTKKKGTIEITPKIGASSFYENSEYDSTKYNSGVQFGVTSDYYFNDRWSLRSGLIFDKMGGTNIDAEDKYEDKLNYLSIPINANWHFGSTRKWNLNFGLSPSFLTKADFLKNGQSQTGLDNSIKSFQLGFTYGIGYKIGITEKFGILIDAQFFNGLTSINNIIGVRVLNAGYSYNIGGVIQL